MWCGGVYFAVMMELGRTIQRAWRTGQQQQQQQQSRASRMMAVMEVIPVILAIGHPSLDMIWFGKGPSDPAVTISVASLRRGEYTAHGDIWSASGVTAADDVEAQQARCCAPCFRPVDRIGPCRCSSPGGLWKPIPAALRSPVILAAHHVDDNSFLGTGQTAEATSLSPCSHG